MVLTNSQNCYWIPLLKTNTCPGNLVLTHLNPPKCITVKGCLRQYVSIRWNEFHIHDNTNDKNPLIQPPLCVYVNPYQAHNLKIFLQHNYKVTFYVVHNRLAHKLDMVCNCNERLNALLISSTDVEPNVPMLSTNTNIQSSHDTVSHADGEIDLHHDYTTVQYKRIKPKQDTAKP